MNRIRAKKDELINAAEGQKEEEESSALNSARRMQQER